MTTALDVATLLDHYERELRPQVEAFTTSVAQILWADAKVLGGVKPIVIWRMKERASLERKLRETFGPGAPKAGRPLSERTLNEYVQDLGGVRVLLHDRTDIAAVMRVIEDQCANETWHKGLGKIFEWNRAAWDVQELDVDPFARVELSPPGGYRSRHYVVRRGANTQIRCEIQLRTVLEEAVFEAHHRLVYRPRQDGRTPSPEAEQVLGALTEMLVVADGLLSDCYRWSREA